ncbi:hypothetical protein [Actimicrobium sp. CCI2.3]|uniref:hypothetical protein n=1 Tax=Actimicrobium sp. CCI2.3 TaxID=3048616 RepID=UPI002AB49438|nr:hypothetical protein [Actimicrobium sp. CCI2.3]MDY7574418.1 hypothetical protein [Actimicrobium sp. CCI2.3]MEB0022504.1 hypothetical protein [Actimicrobium sp. CCI2.3]
MVATFAKRFPGARIADSAQINDGVTSRSVQIAIGPAALRALLQQTRDGVVVAVGLSRRAYRDIVDGIPAARRASVTAIFADPSPLEQFRLIAALCKTRVTVAVLLSESNAELIPVLRLAATYAGLDLQVELVPDASKLYRALDNVSTARVLLALPDHTIYNPETIRSILITTYRRDQLVIGYAPAVVKAGATATTYTTVDDIAIQAKAMLDAFGSTGHLPEAQFPTYFQVAINDSVARSLNLVVDDSVRQLARRPQKAAP